MSDSPGAKGRPVIIRQGPIILSSAALLLILSFHSTQSENTAGPQVRTSAAEGSSAATPAPADLPPPATVAASDSVAGWPVMLGGRELFRVRRSFGDFGAEERASAIQKRIINLVRDRKAQGISISRRDGQHGVEILAGDRILLVVTDQDVAGLGIDREEAARRVTEMLQQAVSLEHRRFSLRGLLLGILYGLLLTVGLVIALVLLKRGYRLLRRQLVARKDDLVRPIRIQNLQLLTPDRLVRILLALARLLRFFLIVLAFYVYVPLLLSFFPRTEGITQRLLPYLLAPFSAVGKAVIGYLPSLAFLLVIGVAVHYLLRFIRFIFREIEGGSIILPGFDQDWAEPTFKLVRIVVLIFGVIVAFPYLPGSNSPAFKGVSLFVGVLFSLGSTSAVAHMVSGVILTYTRAFRIGDRVKIADTEGDVIDKTLLVTRIRTIKNVDITVPNAMVLGSHVVNFSATAKETGLILNTGVSIGYDVPWRKVHVLLLAAAKETAGIAESPPPFVLQKSLDDNYVNYELNAYTREPSRMAVLYSELHQHIQDQFESAKVEILSPAYRSVRDGNPRTVPWPAEGRQEASGGTPGEPVAG